MTTMKRKIMLIVILGLVFYSFPINANCGNFMDGKEKRLEKMVTSKGVEDWIKDLSSEEAIVRRQAAESLGYLKSKEAVPSLIKLLNDNCWQVREGVIWALKNIKDVKAVEPLMGRLKEECRINDQTRIGKGGQSTVAIRIQAELIDALYLIGFGAIPTLMKVVEDKKEDKAFKYKIGIILGRLGERKILPLLIEALENEKEGIWRSEIAIILGKLGDKKAIPYLKNSLKDEYMEQDSDSGVWHYRVRQCAIISLGELKATEVVPDLVEILNKEKNNGLVYVSLGKIGDKRVVPILIDILRNSKDGKQRAYAASALGDIGDKDAIPILKEALNDNWCTPSGIYPVRDDASNALKKMGVKIKKEGNEYKVIEE